MNPVVDNIVRRFEALYIKYIGGGSPYLALAGLTILVILMIRALIGLLLMEAPN